MAARPFVPVARICRAITFEVSQWPAITLISLGSSLSAKKKDRLAAISLESDQGFDQAVGRATERFFVLR